MKKLLVIGLLVIGGLWVCKKTNLCSYAGTLWANGKRAVKNQVPRQFEIDRARNEIEKLDADVRALLGPIAEKKAATNRLRREVQTARANHQEMRANLLALTQKVEAGTELVSHDNQKYTLDEAKAKLAQDFAAFKAFDAALKSREQLLAAQEQNIRLAQRQLEAIATQKRTFEVRLAQLEATEEHLNLQQITAPLRVDEGRVADIKNTLDSIQQNQEVEKERRVLEQQFGSRGNRPRCETPTVNPQEVRNFLNGKSNGRTKVAENK